MNIIKPSVVIETPLAEYRPFILRIIEAAGRNCYKSECKITEDSASPFVEKIVHVHKHESVIEHAVVTVRFIIDRGVSHELVRHRLAAYSQESTRYCNYSKDGFGNQIQVIDLATGFKFDLANENHRARYNEWQAAMEDAERHYLKMIELGSPAQEARSVLPNSLKTEVVMTANMREWRHVFRMRCSKAAHPQIREVMLPLLEEFKKHLPELYNDIVVEA